MKAMPSPAITACLMVSLEPISMPGSSMPARHVREKDLERDARARSALADEEILLARLAPWKCRALRRADGRAAR